MDNDRNQWLYQEIGQWQAEGILDEKTGDLLRARYPLAAKSRASWGILILSVLGGLLVGLGVISLFAANWHQLSRGARAGISLLPLASCCVAGILGLRRKWQGTALWEGLGVAWVLSLLAGVCLVLQTYQVGGDSAQLVLVLGLLSLPILWVTRSVIAMSGWLGYPLAWFIYARENFERMDTCGEPPVWVALAALAFLACSLPSFYGFVRREKEPALERLGFFLTGGAYPGIVMIFLWDLLCFLPWDECVSAILSIWLCAALLGWLGKRAKFPCWESWARFYAFAAALWTPFPLFDGWEQGMLLVLALALAAWLVFQGIHSLRSGVLNQGFFLAFWLILVKFFSSEMSLLLKGFLFLFSGLCLLAVNVSFVIYRKRRNLHEENA